MFDNRYIDVKKRKLKENFVLGRLCKFSLIIKFKFVLCFR